MWIAALLLAPALGACPEEPVTDAVVSADLDLAFASYVSQDVETYVVTFSALEMHMACLEEAIEPTTATRYLQFHGVHGLILEDPEQAAVFFQGARFADPDAALSDDVLGAGMGEPEAWAAAAALPAPQPTTLPEVAGVTFRVNGKDEGVRPEGAPAVLQVLVEDGTVHWTGVIATAEEIPAWVTEGDLAASEAMTKGLLGANGYRMLAVEPGTFHMGSDRKEKGRDADETRHEVTLTRAFLLGSTEVPQGLWEAVVGSNKSRARSRVRPMEQITWLDAVEFCNKLSTLEGLDPVYTVEGEYDVAWDREANGYRLPTEAEWEYAARGGVHTRYSGSDSLKEVGWYGVLAGGRTHEPGRLAPNAWGLHDMTGNVFEWVWDWHAPFTEAAATDPTGPEEGSFRVFRGGAFNNTKPSDLRVAERKRGAPSVDQWNVGFRLARNAD